MSTLTPVLPAATQVVDTGLATATSRLLVGSGTVLAIAMVLFCIDLAKAPSRRLRAGAADRTRGRDTAAVRGATRDAGSGGSTAVLTRTAPAAPDEPATPSRKWAGYGMVAAWLGTFLLLGAIVCRGLSVSRPPLGNMYEFMLAGCAFTMLTYLLWSLRQDVRWLGAFVTGIVALFEMLAGTVYYTDASQLMPSLRSYWLSIHVTVATLSVGLFVVAFCLNVLYLAQEARERGRLTRAGFLDKLPDSGALDRGGYGLIIIAFPLWTFTLIAGAIWAQQAWGHYWNWDPKEVWTLVIWVVYAAYLHARVTAGWSGRKATMLALAGFACVLINYGVVNLYFVGQHSYSGI